MLKQKRFLQKIEQVIKGDKLALVLFALGLLLFSGGSFLKPANSAITTNSNEVTEKKNWPQKLLLPSLSFEVGVSEGGIISGNWILKENSALYLPTSGGLGEGYNTILYGHNSDQVLGKIKNLKIGDLVLLEDNAGKRWQYKVYEKENVSPTDLDKLKSFRKNNLTLYTCDGWLDRQRLLVRAELVWTKL